MNDGHVTGLSGVEMVLNTVFLFCMWLSELLGYELQASESRSENSAAGCGFVSGKSKETWEAVRCRGQEKSFPCSSNYVVIARFPSVCCSDQRG